MSNYIFDCLVIFQNILVRPPQTTIQTKIFEKYCTIFILKHFSNYFNFLYSNKKKLINKIKLKF